MPNSTIGAQIIAKQEKLRFSCLIRKVVCVYDYSDDAKGSKAVLYVKNDSDNIQPTNEICASVTDEKIGILKGMITNNCGVKDFYFISNNKGKEINLECTREVNYCTDEEHSKYDIDYRDVKDCDLKTECRNIDDGKLVLYYYDLFYRDDKFGEIASSYTHENAVMGLKTIGAMVGRSVGDVTGSAVDLLMALRFFLLPIISDKDYKYDSHVSLYYRECPQIPSIPSLTIHIYPDIEFSFKVGFFQLDANYYGDLNKTSTLTKNPYNVDFSVKYNGKTHKLSLDGIDKTKSSEIDAEIQKATIFYKTLQYIAHFFSATADFSKKLEETVEGIYGKNDNITNDLNSLSGTFDKLGNGLAKSSAWLSGTIEINPSLSLNWKYHVSKDLCQLRKHLKIEFGVQGKGMLTIDLVGVYLTFFKKAKKATAVAVAGSTIASGGLAALPSILIKFLVDQVVQWMMKKFKESCRIELQLLCSAEANALQYDSIKEEHFDFASVKVEPEIKLFAGLKFKDSISLFLLVKAEYDIGASGEISSSIEYNFDFQLKEKKLGLEINGKINPIKIRLEYHVVGGYTISVFKKNRESSYKKNREFAGKTKEWQYLGHNMKSINWEIFDFNPN